MKKTSAYTLLEIMIAMFIFAILATIVTTSISTMLIAREKNMAKVERLSQLQLAMSIIERDIEQIIDRPITNEIGLESEAFVNDRDLSRQYIEFTRMGFINPLLQNQRSTLQRVAYEFKDKQLMRITWTALDRMEDNQQQRILLEQIQTMKWRFLDKQNHFYDIWPPTTHLQNDLPQAVELTLTLEDWGTLQRLFRVIS